MRLLKSIVRKLLFWRKKEEEIDPAAGQPYLMFGIPGWNVLEGTLPRGRHGYGCECWSCMSQVMDPMFDD